MDVDGKRHPTLDQFKAETGIIVQLLREDVNSNEEYFAAVQSRLAGGPGHRPRHLRRRPTTRASRASTSPKAWVQPLDKELIPNFENLIESQASPPFDPDRTYSLPRLGGMTGIGWNEDLTEPVTTPPSSRT